MVKIVKSECVGWTGEAAVTHAVLAVNTERFGKRRENFPFDGAERHEISFDS